MAMRVKTWLKRLGWAILACVLLFMLFIGWLFGTASGGTWLVNTALPYATPYLPKNMQLHTEKMETNSLADVRIGLLQFSDSQGVWLEIREIRLLWQPFSLVKGRWLIDELSAGYLHFMRPPESLEAAPEVPVNQQVSDILKQLKTLPEQVKSLTLPPIQLKKLSIPVLVVDSDMAQFPGKLELGGQVNLLDAPFHGEIRLASTEGVATTAVVTISGIPQDASILLEWREAEDGILGHSLDWQTAAASHASIALNMKGNRISAQGVIDAGERPFLSINLSPETFDIQLPKPDLSRYLTGFDAPLALTGQLLQKDEVLSADITAKTDCYTASEKAVLHDISLHLLSEINEQDQPFALNANISGTLQQENQILPFSAKLLAKGTEQDWVVDSMDIKFDKSTLSGKGAIGLGSGEASLLGEAEILLPPGKSDPEQRLKLHFNAEGKNLWQAPEAQAKLTLTELQADLPEPARKWVSIPINFDIKTDEKGVNFTLKSDMLNGEGRYSTFAEKPEDNLLQAKLVFTDLGTVTANYTKGGFGSARINSKSLQFNTDYRLTENRLTLSPVKLAAEEAIILNGDATVDLDSTLVTGQLKGTIRSLKPLADFGLPVPDYAADKSDVLIQLSQKQKVQQAALTFNASGLKVESLEAKSIQLKAGAELPKDKPIRLDARLEAAGINAPITTESLWLTARGDLNALDVKAELRNLAEVYHVKTAAKLALGDMISVHAQELDIAWAKHHLSLAEPTTFSLKGEEMTLAPTHLQLDGKPVLEAEAKLGATAVNGRVSITKLPFSALPGESMAAMKGSLDAQAKLSGAAGNPVLELSARAEGLNANYPHTAMGGESKPLTLTAESRIGEGQLRATVKADAEEAKSTLEGVVAMPFTLSLLPGKYRAEPGETLDAKLDADIILAPFLPLFAPDGIYGNGHLVAHVTANGAWEKPQIRGSFDLHSGYLEVLESGTVLKEITLKATADEERIAIREGSATDGDAGRITLTGTAGLGENQPVDITLTLADATLMRHPNANATLGGNLHLKGDASGSALKGKITIQKARITIAGERSKGSIPELKVQEVASLDAPISPEKEETPEEKAKAKPDFSHNMALDVAIVAPNQIFVEGFGLDAELKANIAVQGTAAAPKLDGKMETIRGRWEFVGRNFTITRGEATLRPDNIAAPLLDIETQAEAGDVTAIAKIQGAANDPKISFSSIPSLPQDEILARVMFGKNMNSISPFQAVQLADMLRTLSGKGGGISTFSKIKDAVGIDDLTVGSSDDKNENVSVGVGKHVSDKVYLGVEGGGGQDSGKVSVEVDLTPNISVETEARQNADTAVRLNYKYDY